MDNQADLKTSIEIAFIVAQNEKDKSYIEFAEMAEKYSTKISLKPVYLENLKTTVAFKEIAAYDAIVLPGAEDEESLKKMREIARIARVECIPLLAFGQGMQAGVLEIAENIAQIKHAGSDQYDPDCSDIFYSAHLTETTEQTRTKRMDHLKRSGKYPMNIQKNTKLAQIFEVGELTLTHDHQTELNLIWQGPLLDAGLIFSGISPDGIYVEAVELKEHPFYLAFIAEPFWKYGDFSAKPLYDAFFKAAFEIKKQY